MSVLVTDPGIEGVEHLWSLWLGLRDGPLVISSDRLGWPEAYDWVLADPLNLLWFGLGAVFSPVLGFHAVLIAGLLAGAIAGVAASRLLENPPPAWLCAGLGAAGPCLAAPLANGMTEVATVPHALTAWVVVAWSLRGPTWRAAAAGVACGLTAWGGPYTAIYALLLTPVLLPLALRSPLSRPQRAIRLGVVAAVAAVVALPVALALLDRPSDLPGSASLLQQFLADPYSPLNRGMGADVAELLAPVQPIGPLGGRAVYLGLVLVVLAVLGAVVGRDRTLVPAVIWSALLGLGYFLQVGGIVTFGGRVVTLPATWLTWAVPELGRAVRWHRFLILTGLLSVPLAAAGLVWIGARLRAPGVVGVVGLVIVVADGLAGSALPWPRLTLDPAPPEGLEALARDGPLSPLRCPGGRNRVRGAHLLWQTMHAAPLAWAPCSHTHTSRELDVSGVARKLGAAATRGGRHVNDAREELRALGYAWIYLENPRAGEVARLTRTLGEPDRFVGEVVGWRP